MVSVRVPRCQLPSLRRPSESCSVGGRIAASKCSWLSSAHERLSSLVNAVSNTELLLLAVLGTGALVFFEGVADAVTTPVTTSGLVSTTVAGTQLGVLGLYVITLTVTTGVLLLTGRGRGRLDTIIINGLGRRDTITQRRLAFWRITRVTCSVLRGRSGASRHLGRRRGRRGLGSRSGCSSAGLRLGTAHHQRGQGNKHKKRVQLHRFLTGKGVTRDASSTPVSSHRFLGTSSLCVG